MKKLITLLLTIVIFTSCNPNNKRVLIEQIHTDVTITSVTTAKYSHVQGYIKYGNLTLPVRNSESGYYYKNYNLQEGQTIRSLVYIHQYRNVDGVIEITCETNFNLYEINK